MKASELHALPDKYLEPHFLYPGQELKSLLEEEYNDDKRSFLNKADRDFNGEGQINDLFYSSFINFLIRRLITATLYINKKYKANGDGRVKSEIRNYILHYTAFRGQKKEKLSDILYRCIEASSDNFNQDAKKSAKFQAKKHDWKCFTCGCQLDLDNEELDNYATHDHYWPRGFGGLSELENLRLLCKPCNNNLKRDYIDVSDHHYEEIALRHLTYQDFEKEEKKYNKRFEFVVLAKSNFTCVGCGKPAYKVGELKMGRLISDDSWHFLNLGAYCNDCNPEI
ncbi:hypothetical protein D9M68_692550 [compost metagenome]